MVGIVSGSGLGLFNTQSGIESDTGAARAGARVNLANGNLVVQATDLSLAGLGTAVADTRTYNLLGIATAGGDGWLGQGDRRVELLGARNAAGSAVIRTGADGHATSFAWNGSAYASSEGDGAHDRIAWNDTLAAWEWTEGSTRIVERYDGNSGLVTSLLDATGHETTYARDASGRITQIADAASGQSILFVYDASGRLARLDTRVLDGAGLTATLQQSRVFYEYDAQGRLSAVKVDLSPGDNSVANGLCTVTRYAWEDDSLRLREITTDEGFLVSFTYRQVDGDWRVATVTDAAGTTAFDYDTLAGTTAVTTATGQRWTYAVDADGHVTDVLAPGVDGVHLAYNYDAAGNLVQATDGNGAVSRWWYDASGNCVREVNAAGEAITRVFSASNQLLNESRWQKAWTFDGSDWVAGADNTALTTRRVLDARDRLVFTVSAEGRVTEYRYGANDRLASERAYPGAGYAVAALAATKTLSLATMNKWVTGIGDKARQAIVTGYAWDLRGNLERRVEYAAADVAGEGTLDASARVTKYVYDASGALLQSLVVNGTGRDAGGTATRVESYTRDAAGRITGSYSSAGTTTTVRDVANRKVTVTNSVSGLVTTQVFDARGRLLSESANAVSAAATEARTTTYRYRADGKQVMAVDALGGTSFVFYDALGRVEGRVNEAGEVSATQRDDAGRVVAEVRCATRVATAGWWDDAAGVMTKSSLAEVLPLASGDDRTVSFAYDDAGRRTTVTDALGYSVVTDFDAAGRAVRVTSGDRVTRSFYDKDGRLAGTLDGEGFLAMNTWDYAGRLRSIVRYANATADADRVDGDWATLWNAVKTGAARTSWYFYDGAGNTVGTIDERQFVTRVQFNEETRTRTVTRYTLPYAGTVTASTSLDAVIAALDSAAMPVVAASEQRDAFGRVVQRTDEAGTAWTFRYDAAGRLVQETVGYGTASRSDTWRRFDAFGEVVGLLAGEAATHVADGATDSTLAGAAGSWGEVSTFDKLGRAVMVKSRDGKRTCHYFDAVGREIFAIRETGEIVGSQYNAFGETVTTRRYDASFRSQVAVSFNTLAGTPGLMTAQLATQLTALQQAMRDAVETRRLDARGQVTLVTGAEGWRTRFEYNAQGQVEATEREQSAGAFTRDETTYNRRGEAVGFTRDIAGLALATRTDYDAFGRVVSRTEAGGGLTSIAYTDAGRTITETDPIGHATVRTLDYLERTLTVSNPLGETTRLAYDDASRRVVVTAPGGGTTTTVYDARGAAVSVTDANGRTTSTAYDDDGNVLKVTDAAGTVIALNTYDAAGRLLTARDANGVTSTWTRDIADTVYAHVDSRRNDVTGVVTRYHVDALGRQVRVVEDYGLSVNRATDYVYDRDGHVLQVITDPGGLSLVTEYRYDGEGRQLRISQGVRSGTSGNYSYAWQRVTGFAYDAAGRLLRQVEDPDGLALATTFAWDANGRLARETDAAGNSTWHVRDGAGRETFTVNALGETTRFFYDAAGRVVSTRRYANAATLPTADVVSSVAITADNTRDINTYTVHDDDGRVRYTVDGAGACIESRYDAAGNVIATIRHGDAWDWPAMRAIGADGFTNASLFNTQPQLFGVDDAGRIVLTNAVGTAKAPALVTADRAWQPGLAWSAEVTLGDTLPKLFLVAVTNRYGSTADAPEGRRLGMRIEGSTLYADLYNENGWGKVALGTVQAGASYVMEIESRAAGALLRVYRKGESDPAQVMRYELRTAGWERASLGIWAFSGPESQGYNGATAWVSNIREAVQASPDREISATRLAYDALGRLRYTFDAAGYVTSLGYDAAGNLVEERRFRDAVTLPLTASDTLDSAALDAQLSGAASSRITRHYLDTAGRRAFTVDFANDRLTGSATAWQYNRYGEVFEERRFAIDDAMFSSNMTMDTLSRQTLETLSASITDFRRTRHVRDRTGREIYTWDALGYVTGKEYDACGRVVATTRYPNALTDTNISLYTTPEYFASRVMTMNSSAGLEWRTTRVVRDAAGRDRFVIDVAGGVREKVFDTAGRVIEERAYTNTAPVSLASWTESTVAAAVASREHRVTRFAYDAAGNLRFTLDAGGYLSETARDRFGRIVAQARYGAVVPAAKVPAEGTAMSVSTLAAWAATQSGSDQVRRDRFVYDRTDDVAFRVDAGGFVTAQVRDGDGNLIRETRYAAPVTVAANATATQLRMQLAAAAGRSTLYRHDALGCERLVIDALGYVTRRDFDADGHVVSEMRYDRAIAGSVADGDDLAALLARLDADAALQAEGGRRTDFAWDRLGRMVEKRDPAAWCDIDGTRVYGNVVTRYRYNGFGELVKLVEGEIAGVREDTGESVVLTAQARTTAWEYDALGRQVRRILPGWYDPVQKAFVTSSQTSTQNFQVVEWSFYDAFGNAVRSNRLGNVSGTATVTSVRRMFDVQDRLVVEVDELGYATRHEYDAWGNLRRTTRYANALSATVLARTPTAVITTWMDDASTGLLVKDAANDRVIDNDYDALGRRTATRQAAVANWEYAGDTATAALAGSGSLAVVQGLDGAAVRGWTSAARGLATTASPEIRYEYDAFGTVRKETVAGAGSTFRYSDALGRVVLSVDAGGYCTTWEYFAESDQVTHRIEYADALSAATLAALTTTTRPALPTAQSSAPNRHVEYRYDNLLRQTETWQRDVSRLSTDFIGTTLLGNTVQTGLAWRAESRSYNAFGELLTLTDANNAVTRSDYDDAGRLLSVTEPVRDVAAAGGAPDATVSVAPVTTCRYNVFGDLTVQRRSAGAAAIGDDRVTSYGYDIVGNRITMTDAVGAVTNYKVDWYGRVIEESLAYDGAGPTGDESLVYSGTKFRTYSYDLLGRHLATNDRYSTGVNAFQFQSEVLGYNAFGEVVTRKLGGVLAESNTYDQAGRLVRQTGGKGVVTYDYDLAGRLTRTGSGGNTTVNRVDALGRVIEQRLPHFEANLASDSITNGALQDIVPLVTSRYDRWGNLVSQTDARGATTDRRYDEADRLVEECLPQDSAVDEAGNTVTGRLVRQYGYDLSGNLLSSTQFFRKSDGTVTRGRASEYTYNAAGQRTREKDALGNTRNFRVDASGNQVLLIDAMGYRHYSRFDAMDRQVETGWYAGNTAVVQKRTSYDEAGNPFLEVFGDQAVVESQQLSRTDGVERSISGGVGNFRFSRYDERGNVLWTRNEAGIARSFAYDGNGRKIRETDADFNNLAWTWDVWGRQLTHTDLSGRTVQYTYDESGLLKSEAVTAAGSNHAAVATSPSDDFVVYEYYANGLLKQARTDATKLASGATSRDDRLLRQYDAAGHVVLEENAVWQLPTNTQKSSQKTRYRYDAQGRLAALDSPLGTSISHDLSRIAYTQVVSEYSVRYDEFGNRRNVVAKASGAPDVDHWFRYDAADRVLVSEGMLNADHVIVAGQDAVTGKAHGVIMQYDADGNRTREERFVRDEQAAIISGATSLVYGYDFRTGLPVAYAAAYDLYKATTYQFDVNGNMTYASDRNVLRNNGDDTGDAGLAFTNLSLIDADGVSRSLSASVDYKRGQNFYDTRGNRYLEYSWGFDGNSGFAELTNWRGDGQVLLRRRWTGGATMLLDSQTIQGDTEAGLARDAAGNLLAYRYEKYAASGTGVARQWVQTYKNSWEAFDDYKITRTVAHRDGYYDSTTQFTMSGDGDVLRTVVGGVTRDTMVGRKGQVIARMEGGAQTFLYLDGAPVLNAGSITGTIEVENGYENLLEHGAGSASRYTVSGSSETASSIAAALLGDAMYWYVIADANGLAGPSTVVAQGTSLLIPGVLANAFNSASTVARYSLASTLGDTTPNPVAPPPPPPKGKKCAQLAQVVMVVIAVVATVLTAGAASPALSAALGTVGATTGVVSTAGMSAFGAMWATGAAALGSASMLSVAVYGAVGAIGGSIASQLAGKAMGVVDHFSWRDVGRAGVSGFIGGGIGFKVGKLVPKLGLPTNAGVDGGINWANVARTSISAGGNYAGGYVTSRLYGENPAFNWQAFAGSMVTAGMGTGLMDRYGGALGLNGKGDVRGLVRSGVTGVAEARARDKWFGGPTPDYSEYANSIVAQYVGERTREKLDARYPGEPLSSGGSLVPRVQVPDDAGRALAEDVPEAGSGEEVVATGSRTLQDFHDEIAGFQQTADEFLAVLKDADLRSRTFRAGDYDGSVERLARDYLGKGASQSDVVALTKRTLAYNGISDASRIRADASIVIPGSDVVFSDAGTAFGDAVYGNDVARMESRRAAIAAAAATPQTTATTASGEASVIDSIMGGGDSVVGLVQWRPDAGAPVVAKSPAGGGATGYAQLSQWLHGGLTVAGMTPLFGAAADGADLLLTAAEVPFGYSDWTDVALGGGALVASAIPGIDQAAGAAKIAHRTAEAARAGMAATDKAAAIAKAEGAVESAGDVGRVVAGAGLEKVSAAAEAAAWQGKGRFPGRDDWRNITLKQGTVIYAGEPGLSGFMTTQSAIRRAGGDAAVLFDGLQVPPRNGLYRNGVTAFEILEDMPAAMAITRANSQYGKGGLPQLYLPSVNKVTGVGGPLPSFDSLIDEGKIRPLISYPLSNRKVP